MDELVSILIPISICVVLPVAVAWIYFRASMNSDNKRAEVLMKAIETNKDINTEKLAEMFQKKQQKKQPTAIEMLNARLQRGCIFSLVGLALLIVDIIGAFYGGWDTKNIQTPTILGSIFLAVGLGYLIVYFVTRKQVEKKKEE